MLCSMSSFFSVPEPQSHPSLSVNSPRSFYGLGYHSREQESGPKRTVVLNTVHAKPPSQARRRCPSRPVFFRAFSERLRQSFQDQVGRLDDALIAWTQIRFESVTRQMLQTNDIANGNLIALLC